MVAGGGGGAPVLSSGGAGSGGCRESERLGAWESLEGAFPALSRIIREPEGAWTPGRPRKAQEGPGRPEQSKGVLNSLYIGVFRSFRSFRQKSKFRFG